jgi:hypothetical protein
LQAKIFSTADPARAVQTSWRRKSGDQRSLLQVAGPFL